MQLRHEGPLALSFWSFSTFSHHAIDKIEIIAGIFSESSFSFAREKLNL